MKENFIILEKNRKDYKIRGYKNLDCSSFFQDTDTSRLENDLLNQGYLSSTTIQYLKEYIFFAKYSEEDGSKYYTTCNSVKNKILEKLFADRSPYDIDSSDIKLKLLERKVNKFGIDTILFEVSPSEGSALDFIPVCIIIYKLETQYINSWRAKEYIPGDNLGIFIPMKYNTVSRYRHGLLKEDMMDTWIEVINAIFPGSYLDLLEKYLPDEYEYSSINKYELDVIYNLSTGKSIPEIRYDVEKLKESMNLIQC